MKEETYYINDLTGEIFHSKIKCLDSERDSAINMVEQVKTIYSTLENHCVNSQCSTCPFMGLTKDGYGFAGCIRDWFDKDYINKLIKWGKWGD